MLVTDEYWTNPAVVHKNPAPIPRTAPNVMGGAWYPVRSYIQRPEAYRGYVKAIDRIRTFRHRHRISYHTSEGKSPLMTA